MNEVPHILIGGTDAGALSMIARMANRHGMIAGATGTGKTVTLQILAEGFSRIGVPVFLADVKGDLSGLARPGRPHPKIDERVKKIKIENFSFRGNPVVLWDLFGELGHPIRTTVSEIGPLLLGNLLELNDTQAGLMYTAFKIADDGGLLLLDFKDLRSMLSWMGDNASDLKNKYGNISSASVGAIQRKLLVLEEQGAENFFAEPAIELADLIRTDLSGQGLVHALDVTTLMRESPRLYATFLLWLLSELFENLPEVGDVDKPKFVMFFDEAHLLFDDAPKPLLDKIEQVVRLIRSKGVGVFFISQSPLDIPLPVLGQLGLRIQHALRAFTPKDHKAVKTVAETFRPNPRIDTEKVITELGIGEALVSVLDEKGSPTPVERVLIRPPESRIGPITADERSEQIQRSPFKGRYEKVVDRESAYEILKERTEKLAQEAEKKAAEEARQAAEKKPRRSSRESPLEAMVKSAARAAGTQLGRQILRGILGSMTKGR